MKEGRTLTTAKAPERPPHDGRTAARQLVPHKGDASENTDNAKYEVKEPTSPHSGRACRPRSAVTESLSVQRKRERR